MNEAPLIAIVDDDDSVRRSLLRVVQSAGYAAEGFASARSFLDWLPQGRAACLLLDVHMSEMSGFDLQDKLAVPIIFITSHDDAKTEERIARSGAIGHLRKPCEKQTVLAAIDRAVRMNDHPRAWQDEAVGSTRPPPDDGTDGHREDGGEA